MFFQCFYYYDDDDGDDDDDDDDDDNDDNDDDDDDADNDDDDDALVMFRQRFGDILVMCFRCVGRVLPVFGYVFEVLRLCF